MCCMRLAGNTKRKNLWKIRHLHTIAHLCQAYVSATKACIDNQKKPVKQQYLFHMSPQYCELRPTNGWDSWWVWGTLANFNGFRVLASLLHRLRSMELNQTLHDVWPSPGMVHYIYILPGAKFTLCPSLAFSYIGSITAWHLSSGHQPNFAAWYLHATGRSYCSTLGSRTV